MLNAFRTFCSTARAGFLCGAAAILLSACGGSTELGNGPEMLNENMPGSVNVSAAPVPEAVFDWRTANGGGETASVPAEQSAETSPPQQAAQTTPAAPPYGAAAAVTPGQSAPLPGV